MSIPTINYLSRDFQTLKNDLINWAKTEHGDVLQYFNDANPDILYLEMCAYVGDVLNYYIDKTFNESFRTTALTKTALYRIANDLGFFNLGPSSSSVQVELSIIVPILTQDGVVVPDPNYLFAIKPGMLLRANNGEFFEVLEEVNFADERNRKVLPNFDSNNIVTDYVIKKYAIAKAGKTKIQKFYVTEELSKPFLSITLDELSVTEIIGVVGVPGNQNIAPTEEEFYTTQIAYFEVRDLVQNKLFFENNPENNSSIKTGEMVSISKRFISRRDVNGLVTLTFGNNQVSSENYQQLIQDIVEDDFSLTQVLNNTTLGEIPPANTTLFIKYRIGGGGNTNVANNQITNIVSKSFYPINTNVNFNLLQQVRNSLSVVNLIDAAGGRDELGTEEIRQTSGKVFAAQDRGVTYEDIIALIEQMPAKYGKPFRISYEEVKPGIADFSSLNQYLQTELNSLLTLNTQIDRELKVQEITTYLNDYSITKTTTENNSLLGEIPTLWVGEKAKLHIVSKDENGQLLTLKKNPSGLWTSSQETLKNNIKEYLKNKRIIGDWIDIVDAKVINFQVEFTVIANANSKQETLLQCLQTLKDYFDINNWQINQPIFVANAITALQNLNNVITVADFKFYNIFGVGSESLDPVSGNFYQPMEIGRYRNISPTPVSAANNKYEMLATNGIIQAYPDSIFECRYLENDIIGKVL